jgi:phage gp36-like protein
MAALIDKDYVALRVKESDLIALTETVAAPNVVNETMVNALIADADAIVLNALRGRYKLPASGTAEAISYLQRLEFDITLYFIYRKTYDDAEMKDVYVAYSKAHQAINSIQAGQIEIKGLDLETNDIPHIVLGTRNRRYYSEETLREI